MPIDHALEHAIDLALNALKIADGARTRVDGSNVDPETGWAITELCDAYMLIHGLPEKLSHLHAEKAELVEALTYISQHSCSDRPRHLRAGAPPMTRESKLTKAEKHVLNILGRPSGVCIGGFDVAAVFSLERKGLIETGADPMFPSHVSYTITDSGRAALAEAEGETR